MSAAHAGPATPIDEAARRRASGLAPEDRRGAMVVEASAGTGKTTVLVERVLALVLEDGIPLSRIVVVTFTELAAAELKQRLRQRLEEVASGLGPGQTRREAVQAALDDLQTAAVGTIHAFAADLLRRHPLEAGVEPGFAVADDLGQRLRFAEAWEEFLRRLDDPSGLEAAFDLGFESEPALRRVAWSVLGAVRRGARFAAPPADPEDAAATLARIERLLAEAAARAQPGGALERLIEPALAAVRDLGRLPEAMARRVLLGRASELIPLQGGSQREAEAKARRAEARALADALVAAWGARRLLVMARWLAELLPVYLRRLSERSQLDFDQLLERADRLLAEHAAVRKSLRERFPAILIDEFQDTDVLQTRLLLRLADDEPAASPVEDPEAPGARPDAWPRSLFVVGDPKQSIYRFRGADVENYRRVLERSGVAQLELRQNFRSRPSIVRWVNETLGAVMPPPGAAVAPWEAAYRPLEAPALPDDPGTAGVVYLELDTEAASAASRGPRIRRVRQAEAHALARFARGLVEGDLGARFRVRERTSSPAVWRPPRYGDIAILLSRLTNLAPYEDALAAEGVPFRVEAGRAFYRRDEVHALVALLAALADPGDSVAVVTALRGPGFGCSDDDLVAFALVDPAPRLDLESAPGAAAIDRSPRPAAARRVLDALDRLRALRRRVADQPLASVVTEVLDECALVPHFALERRGEQKIANLLKAVDIARRLEEQGARSLPALLGTFRALIEEELQEPDSPAHEGPGDAVRLLTVHAAKGLEFEVVLLGGLSGTQGGPKESVRVLGGELRLGRLRTPGWEEAEADDDRRDEAERKRCLYVAATRARDLLVVPWAPRAGLGRSEMQPIHAFLFAPPDGGKGSGPGAPQAGRGDVVLKPSDWPPRGEAPRATVDLDALLAEPPPDDTPGDEDPGGAPSERAPAVAMRPWSLRAARGGAGEAGAGDAEGSIADDGAVDRGGARGPAPVPAPADRAARLGLAAHALLARHFGARQVDERLATLAAPLREEAERWIAPCLAGDLGRRAARSTCRLVEEPVAARFGARVLDGRVDLAFLEAEGWVLVDWKTDQVEPEEAPARAAGHARQLALYALALEAATGRAACELRVVFVRLGEAAGLELRGDPLRRLLDETRREAAGLTAADAPR